MRSNSQERGLSARTGFGLEGEDGDGCRFLTALSLVLQPSMALRITPNKVLNGYQNSLYWNQNVKTRHEWKTQSKLGDGEQNYVVTVVMMFASSPAIVEVRNNSQPCRKAVSAAWCHMTICVVEGPYFKLECIQKTFSLSCITAPKRRCCVGATAVQS